MQMWSMDDLKKSARWGSIISLLRARQMWSMNDLKRGTSGMRIEKQAGELGAGAIKKVAPELAPGPPNSIKQVYVRLRGGVHQ